MTHPFRHSVSGLAFLAAGCTSMNIPPPGTMAPVAPAASPSATLARTQDFIIVRVATGDTYASLARTYLGDAGLADLLADANGARAPEAGRPLIVPLKTSNPSGVFIDGYQTAPILCYHQFTA